MHIPDGYLSPQTYIPLYAAFAGFRSVALKKLQANSPPKTSLQNGVPCSHHDIQCADTGRRPDTP